MVLSRILRATILLLPAAGLAQDATVTGVVTDSKPSVIPGVHISVRNVDTGIERTLVTDHKGDYTITSLAPGKYTLTADLPGFRLFKESGIVLEIGQTLRVDIPMTIGAVNEVVNVTAQVAAINTENGAVTGDVISMQEINDIPLDGRDFTDLALLVPGVMPAAQGSQGSGLNVNGARADSTNYYVDGFNDRNPRGAAAQARPNMDAMQEFKMEVSGFSAEMGRMAGGVMNMVLKSGANQPHGDVFMYARNNIMDARGFFDQQKNALHRYQYGAMFSGPVVIPRLYDGRNRTFFLFSWEGYKQRVQDTSIGHVPSLLERQGDFSQSVSLTAKTLTITDPYNAGKAFANNILPLSRFSPIAVKLLAYYPLPNRPDPRNNFITTASDPDAWDSFIVKTDHRFNDKNSMSYRYQKRVATTTNPFGGSNPLGNFGTQTSDPRSLMGLDFTHLFSPAFLVELRTGFSRNDTRDTTTYAGIDIPAQLGMTGTTKDPELIGFPRFNVTDYSPLGGGNGFPDHYTVTDIQYSAKFTWIKSSHTMKFGYEIDRTRFNEPYLNNNRGTYAATGSSTTSAMADFLLGQLNTATRQVGINRNYLRQTNMGAYFSDDFKARANLTLNLGVRYEFLPAPTDRYNHLTNFVPSLGKVVLGFNDTSVTGVIAEAGLTDRVTYAQAVGLPSALVNANYKNFAPRFGLAWTPFRDHKLVLRSGYGIFYTGILLNPYRNSVQNTFPYAQTETYTHVAATPDLVTLANPFPAQLRVAGGTSTSAGIDVNAPTGYMQSWNLTIERDLGHGVSIEVGYVGSKGTHLGRLKDINLPRRTLAAYLASVAVVNLRPFPFFNGAINLYQFNSNSIYNSGQISLRKRGRGGTFYRLNWQYSKSIDDASQLSGASNGGLVAAAQDINNRRADRARSDWDVGHAVTASFSYPIPVGRGKTLLTTANGIVDGVMGGWQFAGTAFFATGQPITVQTAGTNLNLGDSQKPNRIATGIPVDIPGKKRGVDYPWFDVNAFVAVPSCISVAKGCPTDQYGFQPFVYGNSGRNILDGPGRAYSNLSMMKNFRFQERKNILLRVECFNALNHPNFLLPNVNFNGSSAGLIIGTQADGGRGGPRVFQAGLRFDF